MIAVSVNSRCRQFAVKAGLLDDFSHDRGRSPGSNWREERLTATVNGPV